MKLTLEIIAGAVVFVGFLKASLNPEWLFHIFDMFMF
jgi:hypothetical protein